MDNMYRIMELVNKKSWYYKMEIPDTLEKFRYPEGGRIKCSMCRILKITAKMNCGSIKRGMIWIVFEPQISAAIAQISHKDNDFRAREQTGDFTNEDVDCIVRKATNSHIKIKLDEDSFKDYV